MADLFAFISGFSACGFLWALRELERRQAFEDAAEEIEALRERERRYRNTINNIKALAWRAHIERIVKIGGTNLLPAPRPTGGYAERGACQSRLDFTLHPHAPPRRS